MPFPPSQWCKCWFMPTDRSQRRDWAFWDVSPNLLVFCASVYVLLSAYFSFPSFHSLILFFCSSPLTLHLPLFTPLPLHLSLSLSSRTESVAEKMLTNWFTFLLYKFLKVKSSHTYTTFKAILIPLLFENRKTCLTNVCAHTHIYSCSIR